MYLGGPASADALGHGLFDFLLKYYILFLREINEGLLHRMAGLLIMDEIKEGF